MEDYFTARSVSSNPGAMFAGNPGDPGLMVRSLAQIFQEQEGMDVGLEEASVTCSYCEVYNEVKERGRKEGGREGEGRQRE